MPEEPAHCDGQARAGMWVIWLMGTMGILALVGLLILAWAKREPSPVVLTAFSGAIGGAMTGLPALMARMANQPATQHANPQNVQVVNAPDEPVPTVEGDKP